LEGQIIYFYIVVRFRIGISCAFLSYIIKDIYLDMNLNNINTKNTGKSNFFSVF